MDSDYSVKHEKTKDVASQKPIAAKEPTLRAMGADASTEQP